MAETLYRICVCVFEINPCRKFNGLKSGILLTEQKEKRHWLLDKSCLTGLQRLQATQQEKNSSEINLSFVLLCLKCSFCGTWLGLMFVLGDLLFCRNIKMYR